MLTTLLLATLAYANPTVPVACDAAPLAPIAYAEVQERRQQLRQTRAAYFGIDWDTELAIASASDRLRIRDAMLSGRETLTALRRQLRYARRTARVAEEHDRELQLACTEPALQRPSEPSRSEQAKPHAERSG